MKLSITHKVSGEDFFVHENPISHRATVKRLKSHLPSCYDLDYDMLWWREAKRVRGQVAPRLHHAAPLCVKPG